MIILIRDLKISSIIGVYPNERQGPQTLLAQIELTMNDVPARHSDRLEDTVDYGALENSIISAASQIQPALIERLAQVLLDACLEFDSRIQAVRIMLEKSGCLRHARAAAISLYKERSPAT